MSPGGADRAVVRRHLMALDDALATLERSRSLSVTTLAADREKLWSVERGLQLCAQNTLDIATHLAAAAGRDVPDYASAMDRLAELDILPKEFASSFRSIAGFRNVLVHGYLDVDLNLVHELLTARLDDFRIFARHIDGYLANRPAG